MNTPRWFNHGSAACCVRKRNRQHTKHRRLLHRVWLLGALVSSFPACTLAPDNDAADSRVASKQSAIVGGDVVAPGAWPNVAWLENGCSAVLVHERVLAYAAHCGEEHTQAWVGDALDVQWDETLGVTGFSPIGATRPLALEVCRTEPHAGRGRDIAYCVLEQSTPIAVAPVLAPAERSYLETGQPTTLVGFGLTAVDSPTAGVKRSVESHVAGFSAHRELVIGDDSAGSCFGDSGGPAFVRAATGDFRLAGILSGGKPGICGAGYYTDVSENLAFLESAGFTLARCAPNDDSARCVHAEPNDSGLFESYSTESERFQAAVSGGCCFSPVLRGAAWSPALLILLLVRRRFALAKHRREILLASV